MFIGQKVPKGLHIRINFETGVTEAKLLDKDEKDQALVYNPNDNPEPNEDEAKFHSKEVEEALKKINSDDPKSNVPRENYRSYEQIKEDLHELNLVPQSDAEILRKLIADFEMISSQKDYSEEELLNIMEDLEYLVHQYDNAQEFVNLDGFKNIVYKNLNGTNIPLKLATLKLLGSSMQNNPKIQIHAIQTGTMDILLRMLSLDNDINMKNRAMYAMSSLLRRFPLAQIKFLRNGGLSVFTKLLESDDIKVQIKIVTLLNDLLLEHRSAVEDVQSEQYQHKMDQYKEVNLKPKLIENNFCAYIGNLLRNVIQVDEKDYDYIEKSLQIMDSLADTCGHDEITLSLLAKIARDLKFALADNHDVYFAQLHEIAKNILEKTKYKLKVEL